MDATGKGQLSGIIGVAIFSGSLPATRAAVAGFDPLFLTGARATIAALLAAVVLLALRQSRPGKADLAALAIVALGVVVGFPLLSSLALQTLSAAQGLVFMGLLPLSTAIFGVVRGGERPHPAFWLFSILGALSVVGYAARDGIDQASTSDALMLAAILACGLGYAEGARLSRTLGGWQVISWALLLALPIMLPLSVLAMPASFSGVTMSAWIGLAYVALFSMLIGFIFWYRGLALGGIAAVGQLQLLQPMLGLALAAMLLGEQVSATMLIVVAAVLVCVAGARRFASPAR